MDTVLNEINNIVDTIIYFRYIVVPACVGIFIIAIKHNKSTDTTRTIYQGNSWAAAKKAVNESIENNNELVTQKPTIIKDEDGPYVETKTNNTSGNSIWYGIWKSSSNKEK